MQHDPHAEVNASGGQPDAWTELFGEPLHVYTRKQALAEGSLVAVPRELAHMTGFRAPVAITRAAWMGLVHDPAAATEVPDDPNRALTTHEQMHLRKVCQAATFRLATAPKKALQDDTVKFGVSGETLWLNVGPDDDGEVCFTIMTEVDL